MLKRVSRRAFAKIAGITALGSTAAPAAAIAAQGSGGPTDTRGASRRFPEGFLWGMTERIVTPILQQWKGLRLDDI